MIISGVLNIQINQPMLVLTRVIANWCFPQIDVLINQDDNQGCFRYSDQSTKASFNASRYELVFPTNTGSYQLG